MQIEVQATTRPTLPKEDPQEAEHGDNDLHGEAKAITDGDQSGSAAFHDVSPASPSGNGNQESNKSGSSASTKSEGTSGQQSDNSQTSTSEDSSKPGNKSMKSTDKSSGSKQGSGQGGTIGGRGTQEEYQEARLRFLNSGQGVLVSADSVSLDEGQVGSLVTASFDDL